MPAKVNHEKLAEAFFIWAENALGLTKLEDYAQKHDKVVFLDEFARLFAQRYKYAYNEKQSMSSPETPQGHRTSSDQRGSGRENQRVAAWITANPTRHQELATAVRDGLLRSPDELVYPKWQSHLKKWETLLHQPDGVSLSKGPVSSNDSIEKSIVTQEGTDGSAVYNKRSDREETDDELD
jgi:hypothetical protein